MKKIKLIHYGNFPYGGASANLLRNMCFAISECSEIEVIMPTGYYYGKENAIINRRGKIEDVKYRYLGYNCHPRNVIGKVVDDLCGLIFPFFYLMGLRISRKIDLVILYNTSFFTTLNILLAKWLFGLKLIIYLPEFYEKPKGGLSLLKWYFFYFSIKYLVQNADGFMVASRYLEHYLSEDRKVHKPILVIPNSIDPEVFKIDNASPFREGAITIGYVGTPTRKDGAMDLIKSFAFLEQIKEEVHLLIVGDLTNGTSLIPSLRELAEELGVADKVTFTGLVSATKVPQLLNSCQILALARPSGVFAEAGFPTKLGEYFSCRKPVVITKVGDIPFYFTDEEQVILVEPDNPECIASGFLRLIQNPKLAIKVTNNGYEWMMNNLYYKNQSDKINNFLRSIK